MTIYTVEGKGGFETDYNYITNFTTQDDKTKNNSKHTS